MSKIPSSFSFFSFCFDFAYKAPNNQPRSIEDGNQGWRIMVVMDRKMVESHQPKSNGIKGTGGCWQWQTMAVKVKDDNLVYQSYQLYLSQLYLLCDANKCHLTTRWVSWHLHYKPAWLAANAWQYQCTTLDIPVTTIGGPHSSRRAAAPSKSPDGS